MRHFLFILLFIASLLPGTSTAGEAKQAAPAADKKAPRLTTYRLEHYLDDPANPGACVWNIGPYKGEKGQEISLALTVTGIAGDDQTGNLLTKYWIRGWRITPKGMIRYNLRWAGVQVKASDSGEILDTENLKKKHVAGEHYEIYMPLSAGPRLATGIIRNGLTITAAVAEEKDRFSYTLPPPDPESAKAYMDCLKLLNADLARRKAEEEAAAREAETEAQPPQSPAPGEKTAPEGAGLPEQ